MLRKIFAVIVTFVLVASFIGVPAADASKPLPPSRVPDASREYAGYTGKDLSIDQILALTPGRVPHALAAYASTKVEVILQLSQPPLAALVIEGSKTNAPVSSAAQQAYVKELSAAQAPVVSSVKAMGGLVLGQFTKAYNGVHVRVTASQAAKLAKLPGVVAVHQAKQYSPDLKFSVPLINADKVTGNANPALKFTGAGVKVAVIDTGIDFTHQSLGGSGLVSDYNFQTAHADIITGTVWNTKVIWGYDFAGPVYGTTGIPIPDPNPIDFGGHGSHVASTIAGLGTATTSAGVAPGALLYSAKVFGDDGGTTGLVPEAIEWTFDPNQDGVIDDHVNVINMSLGSAFVGNIADDPEAVMTNYAAAMGIVVVTSAGNSGDYNYAAGFPGNADSALSVAATATGWVTGPSLGIQGSVVPTQTNIMYAASSGPAITDLITGTLAYAANIAGAANNELCTTAGIAAGALADKIALVSRGTCSFVVKIANAAALGAKAIVVFNSAAGGDTFISMLADGTPIPSVFIWRSNGLNLAKANGQTLAIDPFNISSIVDAQPADSIASFSSRGPRGEDSKLKPEISAPGLNIFAAAAGTGTNGVAMSGTSMASPHVAGVAALLRQAHPLWSTEMVKANLMSSAVDPKVQVGPTTWVTGLDVARNGAGRVDAEAAAYAGTVAIGDMNLVSLSWGYTPFSGPSYFDTKYVKLINLSQTPKVYSTTVSSDSFSYTAGVTITVQTTVSVDAQKYTLVPVNIHVNAAQVAAGMAADTMEEYAGLVTFTDQANPADDARVPYYIVPRPYSEILVDAISAPGGSDATAMLSNYGAVNPSKVTYLSTMMFHLPQDRSMTPAGDMKAFGLDYWGPTTSFGHILGFVYSSYGSWHMPDSYYIEFDTWFDTNFDGLWDYVSYNTNLGSAQGGNHNGTYVTVLVNLIAKTGVILPYTVFSDYNAGFMEQIIPVTRLGLTSRATVAGKYGFDYQVLSWDFNGNAKSGPVKSYNYLADPVYMGMTAGQLDFGINNLQSFNKADPAGVMVVDYNGQPGSGQVTTVDYDFGWWMQLFNPFSSNGYVP